MDDNSRAIAGFALSFNTQSLRGSEWAMSAKAWNGKGGATWSEAPPKPDEIAGCMPQAALIERLGNEGAGAGA